MRHKFILMSVIVLFLVGSSFAGTITYYTDYAAWLAATSPASFNPPGPCTGIYCHYAFQSTPVNQSQNPFTSVLSTAGHFGAPSGVFVGTYDQVWTDRFTNGGGEFTTWSLATGQQMTAFGGYWDFSPAGYGNGLTLSIAGAFGSMAVADICNPTNCNTGVLHTFAVPDGTWFGIVTDFSFANFTITADHQAGNAETIDLAGLDLVAAVPEPGSMVLLGTGLLGIAGAIRRRLTR